VSDSTVADMSTAHAHPLPAPRLDVLVPDDLARDPTLVGPHYPGAGGSPVATEPLDLDALADQLVASAVAADQRSLSGSPPGTRDGSERSSPPRCGCPPATGWCSPTALTVAAGITGAELIELPGAAHVLNEADRAAWLRHVRAFLSALPAAA
jgi:pimeloyl-ACP methyl ester carboxylesterase